MRRCHVKPRLFTALFAGAALNALAAPPARAEEMSAAADLDTVEDLRDLSIEQLAQLEVRSASKQAEPISRAPTSIYVITAPDILRSLTTIPARLLGLEKERGRLRVGMAADLIAVPADPRSDIGALFRTELVVKSGRVIRQSGAVAGAR